MLSYWGSKLLCLANTGHDLVNLNIRLLVYAIKATEQTIVVSITHKQHK